MRLLSRKLIRSPLLLLAFLVPLAAGAQHFPPDEDLQLMLRYVVEDTGTPGVVLGVLEADGSTRIVHYGSAGPGAQELGPRSQFQIASITKTFTATLLADMVSRGEVALDDPVARFLPAHVRVPSRGGREITMLDLATHRSDLPAWPTNLTLRGADPLSDYTTEDLYSFLSDYELRGVPGTGYLYSNAGYGLLGHALARAAGMSYRELLRERIFDPLGMKDTDIAVNGELGESMVFGHISGEAVPNWFATEALQGAGAAISTAEDLLTFMKANVGTPETDLERAMRIAQEVRVRDGDRGAGWGFSWRTGLFPDGERIRGHGGEAGGFRSRLAFAPDGQVGVVVLANDTQFAEDFETMLLYLDPPEGGWIEVPVDRGLMAQYTGAYSEPERGGEHFVRLEDEGHLTYQASNGARTRLHARSDTTFYALRGPWSFTFRVDETTGGATMTVDEDARSRSADRTTRTAFKVTDDTPPPAVVAGQTGTLAPEREGRWSLGMIGLVAALAFFATLALLRLRRVLE